MAEERITVTIKGSSTNQDSLRESDLDGSNFYAVLTVNATATPDQLSALKYYVKKMQDGTDTSTEDTAILAL